MKEVEIPKHCGQSMLWTSYNREIKPDAPPDHWTCAVCGKAIEFKGVEG